MKQLFEILIADRNPHVRELLKRELACEEYLIRTAPSGHDALKRTYGCSSPDLIIIDPDMPDIDEEILLRKLKNRVPSIQIILHVFPSDDYAHSDMLKFAIRVEKKENSVEEIRKLVADIHYARFADNTGKSNGSDEKTGRECA